MASSATDSQNRDKDIREQLIKTGHVDVMISVANNFFYTKSHPCSLWFFDRGKREDLKDKVLFVDARNYYTIVDRTLNEWNEWQLRNLNAIVWLYRGEGEKYKKLLSDYEAALKEVDMGRDFSGALLTLKDRLKGQQEQAKEEVEKANRRDKKALQAEWDAKIAGTEELIGIANEAVWLYDKFGEGEYCDVPGLCRIATLTEIEEKGWSLTPGAYVGVAAVKTDNVDFSTRMKEIHSELLSLQAESNDLMATISKNMDEIGG